MQFLGILAFIIALLLSVMIHEFGHYLTARRFGMKVSEFFLGFGKKLWSTQKGETEFGLKAIPAGGYCRIEGMVPSDTMPLGQEGRAFYRASSGKKLIVLGAGSFLHFVIGFVLLFALFFGVGTTQVTSTIGQISPCVPPMTGDQKCKPSSLASPAKVSGLLPGDTIVSINGKRITKWIDGVEIIRSSAGKEIILGIDRSTKVQGVNPQADPDLEIAVTPQARVFEGKTYGFVGIINQIETVRSNPLDSLNQATTTTGKFISASVKSLISLPSKVPELWSQTVGGKPRDPEGLVGVVGVARVSGQAAGSSNLSASERIATFLIIIASLNIFVGLFNLLPILPLDGGHMAVAIADEVRAFFARLRGRGRPPAIDVSVLTPITMVVFVLLAGLTLVLLFADIVNPVNLNL